MTDKVDLLRGNRLSKTSGLASSFISSVEDDSLILYSVIKINIAHLLMLNKNEIIDKKTASKCIKSLKSIDDSFQLDSDLEDVHMNVESFVIDRIGSEIGGQLNLAKSRNDQVASAIRMTSRQFILDLLSNIHDLQKVILTLAKSHTDYLMPSFTHLQHAQIVTLSHHLLAHYDSLSRDAERFQETYRRVNKSPQGSGAIASVIINVDRDYVAKLLGFDGLVENSIDATTTRDFCIELMSNLTLLMLNVEKIVNELVLWSTSEFSYVEISDEFSSTSSIMPQKKNPVIAELIRSKSSIIIGDLVASIGIIKSLTLGYSIDLQDLTPRLWNSLDKSLSSIQLLSNMLSNCKFNKESMSNNLDDTMIAADLANYLASNYNISFRQSHHIVGTLSKTSADSDKKLSSLVKSDLLQVTKKITGKTIKISVDEIDSIFNYNKNVNSKTTKGSPSASESNRMINVRKTSLANSSKFVKKQQNLINKSELLIEKSIKNLSGGGT
uniref:Argininosuccinate lyase n=1 Tax=uncultured marine thaumarchaeote KM3_100_D10 TaxID=1455979 RepID=A0A075G5G5_9ARCH|nr:argininosuccinate lyase (argH, ASL) [uncultured marine thaumarchaeote KM3_100_D10]